jgi:hypothetical protein
VIAKLAKLLLGISKPLKETFLVDVLDRAGADAGVEQGTIRTAFASTNPTNVCKQKQKIFIMFKLTKNESNIKLEDIFILGNNFFLDLKMSAYVVT